MGVPTHTTLWEAAAVGDTDRVRELLLQTGIGVDAVDLATSNHLTALHLATVSVKKRASNNVDVVNISPFQP
jgi:hypothetical protein